MSTRQEKDRRQSDALPAGQISLDAGVVFAKNLVPEQRTEVRRMPSGLPPLWQLFQVRVRFGGCYPRKNHIISALALPRVYDDPRFFKIEKFAPHFIGHSFRVYSEADLDSDVQRWMHEAYEVGAQKHLKG